MRTKKVVHPSSKVTFQTLFKQLARIRLPHGT